MLTASDREFVAFVDEIGADLRRTTRRLAPEGVDADDLAAEALARTYARWDSLRDAEFRRAWVFKVVANLALSARSSGRRAAISLRRWATSERAVRTGGTASPESEATEHETLRALLRALPPRQREAITLHFVADLSLDQTAQVMGVSRETVKTHVERGLTALRKNLDSPEAMLRD